MTDQGIKAGTAGGTLLIILIQVPVGVDDIVRTAILAATGAIVSYAVSLVVKLSISWLKRKLQ